MAMLTNLRARQRHQRLLRATHQLLRRTDLYTLGKTSHDVTVQNLVDYVFARCHIDLSDEEAQRYLNAARVLADAPPATSSTTA